MQGVWGMENEDYGWDNEEWDEGIFLIGQSKNVFYLIPEVKCLLYFYDSY